jgi:hypothetical protein
LRYLRNLVQAGIDVGKTEHLVFGDPDFGTLFSRALAPPPFRHGQDSGLFRWRRPFVPLDWPDDGCGLRGAQPRRYWRC